MHAALFDMDGVVVDSERYWVPRERTHILPETVDADVSVSEITGMNIEDIYDYLHETYPMKVDRAGFLARFDRAAETIYCEEVALMAGFEALLADLREAGWAVALVSSAPVSWIDLVTDRFDLAFDAVVSADHVERGKPDPDVYLHAATRLDVAPEACVAIEDSGHGVAAAKAAGMRCLGFLGETNDEETLAAADAVTRDAAGLRALLLEA
jgi:HAD superfamily hydrolase (TIGR01509 family)